MSVTSREFFRQSIMAGKSQCLELQSTHLRLGRRQREKNARSLEIPLYPVCKRGTMWLTVRVSLPFSVNLIK